MKIAQFQLQNHQNPRIDLFKIFEEVVMMKQKKSNGEEKHFSLLNYKLHDVFFI